MLETEYKTTYRRPTIALLWCSIISTCSLKFCSLKIYPWATLLNPRYVKSRNDAQLRSNSSLDDVSGCKPEDYSNGQVIVPCGLIAWSLFNDTYNFSSNNQQLAVNKKGISWKSDREHKFGKNVYPRNFQNGKLIGGAHLVDSIPVRTFLSCCKNPSVITWTAFLLLYGCGVTVSNCIETVKICSEKVTKMSDFTYDKHECIG